MKITFLAGISEQSFQPQASTKFDQTRDRPDPVFVVEADAIDVAIDIVHNHSDEKLREERNGTNTGLKRG